jgi:hypothetical protein
MEETETKFDRWVTRIYFGFMFSTPFWLVLGIFLATK